MPHCSWDPKLLAGVVSYRVVRATRPTGYGLAERSVAGTSFEEFMTDGSTGSATASMPSRPVDGSGWKRFSNPVYAPSHTMSATWLCPPYGTRVVSTRGTAIPCSAHILGRYTIAWPLPPRPVQFAVSVDR